LEKVKTKESTRLLEFALVFIMAIAFSSFTLWLIDSYLKYVLFVFETFAIFALFLTINQYHVKSNFWKSTIKLNQLSFIPDVALIIGSLILILLNLFDVNAGLIQLGLSLILTAFLCGYCLLNILGIHSHFSRLELFVLSYVTSFLFSGFVFLCFLPFNQMVRTILLCSVFLLTGLLSIAKHLTLKGETSRKSFSRPQDLLIISLAITFYLIIFFSMYPQTGLIMGNDIVAHSVFSTILSRTPAFYVWSNYMIHDAFVASFLSLSGGLVDLLSLQSALASLMVMFPLAFYITAKEYLEHIDKRLPSLATLFWCLFQAGYGWIYFTFLKINSNSLSQFELLVQTSDKTYFSTTYSIYGSAYFLPVNIAFIMVLFLLLLLKRENVPSSKFIVLFSLIVAAVFLTHIAEAAFFVMFIVFWGLISKNKPATIGRALKASIIGFLIVLITYIGVGKIIIIFWVPELVIAIVLPIILVAFSIVFRRSSRWWNLISVIKAKINKHDLKSGIVFILVFFYFLALLAIPYAIPSFGTPLIMNIFSVPWFFYPLILGVTGSLCLIGLIFIIRDEKLYSALSLIIAFALFTFITARVISFTNANLFYTSFYENRFIIYLLLASSLIAPITVLKFKSRLDCSFRKHTQRMLVSVLLIGLLVVSGASTTFLNIEYCSVLDAMYAPNTAEIEALTFLRNVFDKDPTAFLVTITAESQVNTRFAAPIVTYASLYPYTGYGPEIALPYLYVNPAFSHGYLYIDARDSKALNSGGYDDRYLAQHLIPMLPVVFENSEVTIYNISRIAPPLPISNQILLLPFNMSTSVNDENQLFCYDMLSQGLYNYTTAFDTDNSIMSANTLLLSFDPKEGNVQRSSIEDYMQFVDSGGNLIILNSDGFGTFAKMFFQSSNNMLEADNISNVQENLTLPKGIFVHSLEPVNESGEIISNFVSSNGTSPYITKMNIGKGQLFYVNVEPLIRYLNQPDSNKSEIYSIIGKLLNGVKMEPLEFQYEFLSLRAPLPASTGYVKEIDLDNAVSINTTSLLFPSYPDLVDDGYREISVKSSNGISVFCNVTSIQLGNYSHVAIQSSEASIEGGKSFYTKLNLNETTKLAFTPNAHLTVTSNHEQFEVVNASSILIIADNPIALWVRTPAIWADSGTFKEVYNLKGLMGRDLALRGGITFSVVVSDSYSLLNNFQINGSYAGITTSYYDELQPLRFATVPVIILAVLFTCILCPVWLIVKHKRIRFRVKRRKII
jgi:hypothetical protein